MPLLFRIFWTRLSHGSVVIRSFQGNLIPREVGRMSEYFRSAYSLSGRLQQSVNIRTFFYAHSHRGRLYLRMQRNAVRGRLLNLEYSAGNIQLQHVVFPQGRAASAISVIAPFFHQLLLHLAQGVPECIRLLLKDELAGFVSVFRRAE